MNSSHRHQETQLFWNSIADWYGERDEAASIEFLRSGGNFMNSHEQMLLGDLSSWCGRAIHLQCSHGNDALSLLNQGAGEVVGVDFSERLLAVARRKTQALGANATWHQCDVLQTPNELNASVDLVYTGKGALCWMTDLDAWAQVVARLLKPNGRFFVHEMHPLDWVWDTQATDYVLDAEHGDYFSDRFRHQLFDGDTGTTPHYRNWTLAQIVNALIAAGLIIDRLEEFPEPFWDQFPNFPESNLHRLPHSFALLAHKP